MHASRISWKKWSDANFDWYFLGTKLNGEIDLARITFLANETNTEEGAQLILMAVHFVGICTAVLASLARQTFFLLVASRVGFFLTAFFNGLYRLLVGLSHNRYPPHQCVFECC